jgi:hypothetical protein
LDVGIEPFFTILFPGYTHDNLLSHFNLFWQNNNKYYNNFKKDNKINNSFFYEQKINKEQIKYDILPSFLYT